MIRPRTSGDANWVRIINGDGCSAALGRLQTGAQDLTLSKYLSEAQT